MIPAPFGVASVLAFVPGPCSLASLFEFVLQLLERDVFRAYRTNAIRADHSLPNVLHLVLGFLARGFLFRRRELGTTAFRCAFGPRNLWLPKGLWHDSSQVLLVTLGGRVLHLCQSSCEGRLKIRRVDAPAVATFYPTGSRLFNGANISPHLALRKTKDFSSVFPSSGVMSATMRLRCVMSQGRISWSFWVCK